MPKQYMTINTHRDQRGNLRAESNLNLSDDLILTFITHKVFGGELVTTASVNHDAHDGFLSHTLYQDYRKTLACVSYPRITAKVMEAQHAKALEALDDVLKEVQDKYPELKIEQNWIEP
jgi:hypothetical protein